jgi:hypothetical protein
LAGVLVAFFFAVELFRAWGLGEGRGERPFSYLGNNRLLVAVLLPVAQQQKFPTAGTSKPKKYILCPQLGSTLKASTVVFN